jgi:hypothetical protein
METHYLHPGKSHLPLPPIQSVPIAAIRLGDPIRKIYRGISELKAVSMKLFGQRTPIKLRSLTPDEKKQNPSYDYELVGGQIRLQAARLLRWKMINAYVLDLTPEEAFLETWWDNKRPAFIWTDIYLELRTRIRYSAVAHEKSALVNELNPTLARRCLKVLALLTPAARAMIDKSIQNASSEDEYCFNEWVALPLADLGNLNPDPAVTANLVERAVKKIIAKKMQPDEVAKLVEWMKAGNSPELYRQIRSVSSHRKSVGLLKSNTTE